MHPVAIENTLPGGQISPSTAPRFFLESGDRLSRAEFERRYEAMPHLTKAELIEGVVYVASPVRTDVHAEPHAWIVGWLSLYAAASPGVRLADNATLRLDLDNVVQPDALLRLDAHAGGRARATDDGYLEGPPELVVEVAASSASIDRHAKLHVYRRNGVPEYLVWQVLDRRIEWFALHEGDYAPLEPDRQGTLRSVIFPGLQLATEALLDGDLATVLARQQAALGTSDHRAFLDRLAACRQAGQGGQPGAAGGPSG